MDPKVKEFLVYSSVLLGVLVYYMINRPKRTPSRLKLRESEAKLNSDTNKPAIETKAPPGFEDGSAPDGSRELSVIFQFNGHSFEAYEVLGLPAGSSRAQVDAAYQKALLSADHGPEEIIRLAYGAIAKKFS